MNRKERDPPGIKRISLEHDRRTDTEYPHGFRRLWPRTEAGAARSFRRGVRQALQHGDADAAQSAAESIRRTQVRKWPRTSLTLRERLLVVRTRRALRAGRRS